MFIDEDKGILFVPNELSKVLFDLHELEEEDAPLFFNNLKSVFYYVSTASDIYVHSMHDIDERVMKLDQPYPLNALVNVDNTSHIKNLGSITKIHRPEF